MSFIQNKMYLTKYYPNFKGNKRFDFAIGYTCILSENEIIQSTERLPDWLKKEQAYLLLSTQSGRFQPTYQLLVLVPI